MALANFLSKTALSASQVLKDFDYNSFQQTLLSQTISIYFNSKTAKSKEGWSCIDMLVRLIARLYPNVRIECIDADSEEANYFTRLAISINPEITISKDSPDVALVVGEATIDLSCLKFFVGSDNWIAKFSMSTSQPCGETNNRLGAGAAACFAAANLFRHVFRAQLPYSSLDDPFIYSTYNGRINEEAKQGPELTSVDFSETVLIGLGAIGNGVAWGVQSLSFFGNLHLVDGETVDVSNLQRYILTTQDDIDKPKSSMIHKFLNFGAAVIPFEDHFDKYLQRRGDFDIYRAAVCVDTAEDRRTVQASLPKRLINAWTQPEQCGLSRHYDFINDTCLACLYPPRAALKTLPELISDSFGFNDQESLYEVRKYLAEGLPLDERMAKKIADCKKLPQDSLTQYIGKQLDVFYRQVICGSILLEVTGGSQKEAAEVPAAFESALAGILLAAEIIIDCNGLREEKPSTIHKLNLLRPITRYTFDEVPKKTNKGCICHDPIYQNRYEEKWQ